MRREAAAAAGVSFVLAVDLESLLELERCSSTVHCAALEIVINEHWLHHPENLISTHLEDFLDCSPVVDLGIVTSSLCLGRDDASSAGDKKLDFQTMTNWSAPPEAKKLPS